MFWQKEKETYFDHFIKLANQILLAAKYLEELFQNPATRIENAKKINQAEHTADKVIHDVVLMLNSSGFILPLDREEILGLIKNLDDVIDNIDDTSEAYYEIYNLEDTNIYAQTFSQLIVETSVLLRDICTLLHNPAKNGPEVVKKCIAIHKIENRADDLKKEALKSLYTQLKEKTITTPQYLAWDEIYRKLEIITDVAEDCANIAEQIILKYS